MPACGNMPTRCKFMPTMHLLPRDPAERIRGAYRQRQTNRPLQSAEYFFVSVSASADALCGLLRL
jgi:hypothetical protein